jgi:PadR family transcriptional regulator, regulatory protein AphA
MDTNTDTDTTSPASPPRAAPAALPTTSYAILGMLSIRPWTAYELTRQLRRSLRYCWPKTESVLYDEPKRLVRLGLATAHQEPAGRRARTVYAITPKGHDALRAWLATEPSPPRFEFEGMLRLLYADQGTKADVLAAVQATRAWATTRLAEGLDQLNGYLADGGPFPDRLHITVLFARFYADLFELTVRWADLAEAEIQAWPRPDGLGMTGRTRDLLEEMAARAETLGAIEPTRPGSFTSGQDTRTAAATAT